MEGRCRRSPTTTSLARASRARKPRRDSRSRFLSGASLTTCSVELCRENVQPNARSLPNPTKESVEYPATSSVPVVVAEHILVQVRLQVRRRDAVVDAADSPLHQQKVYVSGN